MTVRLVLAVITALALLSAPMGGLARAAETPDFRSKDAGKRSSTTTIWFYGSSAIREGGRLLHEGEFFKAIKLTEAALAFNLTNGDRWLARNILCIANVRVEAAFLALEHCDKAVSLRPDSWYAYNNRANAALALARYDEAIADYETALELTIKAEQAAEARENASRDAVEPDPPTPGIGGPSGILQEMHIEDPAAIVRKNLQMARKLLKSAERL